MTAPFMNERFGYRIQVRKENIQKPTFILNTRFTRAGRSSENTLVLEDETLLVSSKHLTIFRFGTLVWISDHSTNGTFCNGQKISPLFPTRWFPGQQLQIGSYTLTLLLIDDQGRPVSNKVKSQTQKNPKRRFVDSIFQRSVNLPFWVILVAIVLVIMLYLYLLPTNGVLDEQKQTDGMPLRTPVPTFTPTPQTEINTPVERVLDLTATPTLAPPP